MATFNWPVGYNLTQGFGDNPSYYAQYGQIGHNGLDLGHPVGTPVYASKAGTVIFEGWGQNNTWMLAPAGICIITDDGDVYNGYAHLNSTVVNKGQSVNQGDLIGYVGQTGAATGPHLHFEFLSKPPNFSNGYAGRVNPAQFNIGVEAPAPQGGEDMIDQPTLITLFRVFLNRDPESDAVNHYVGNYSTSFVVNDLNNSPERSGDVSTQQQVLADLQHQVAQANADRDAVKAALTISQTALEAAKASITDLTSKLAAIPTPATTSVDTSPSPQNLTPVEVAAIKILINNLVIFVKQVFGVQL